MNLNEILIPLGGKNDGAKIKIPNVNMRIKKIKIA